MIVFRVDEFLSSRSFYNVQDRLKVTIFLAGGGGVLAGFVNAIKVVSLDLSGGTW